MLFLQQCFCRCCNIVREAYLILYYARCFFLTDTLLVNSGNPKKKAKSPSDAKRDKTESEVYDDFLSTELCTEDEA